MCLPDSCQGDAIELLVRQIVACPGSSLVETYLSEGCWGLNQTVVRGFLNGTWDVLARLAAIQAYTGNEPLNVQFHCGDNVAKSWDAGAIVSVSWGSLDSFLLTFASTAGNTVLDWNTYSVVHCE